MAAKPRKESREERRARIAERVATLPTEPGCYLMKDAGGRVFYIGKAANLRARVRGYFSGGDTRAFVAFLDDILVDIEFILVHSEKEALLLERTLVKEHQPRFNVLLKDDKNFIHLRLDVRTPPVDVKKRRAYPRLEVVRNPREDGARYFGPFHSATSVRRALRVANRHFQLRTCSDSVLENRARPCLQFQIGRCPAPCVQEVPDYGERVNEAALFLSGRVDDLVRRLEERMWEAAGTERFEVAARLRDQLDAVKTTFASQTVTDVAHQRDQDIYGVVREGALLEIARVVVRRGRMVSSDSFFFDGVEFPTPELVRSFLVQMYAAVDLSDYPDEILLDDVTDELAPGDVAPDAVIDEETERTALSASLSAQRGKKVSVEVPKRGHRHRLVALARKNAEASLVERQERDDARVRALDGLKARLHLPRLPRVIECFDISLFQGTDAVASQVCFTDGVADKARYRHYNIKSVDGTDDFAMIYEAVFRRLKRGADSADLPDLLLVDGGKGQLMAALRACKDAGVAVGGDGLMLASIAKARTLEGHSVPDVDEGMKDREIGQSAERIFLPDVKDPIPLRPHTHERFLVEQVRDEAHRFAITAHRAKRKKRTLRSSLDDIPGIGEKKRRALLKALGSVAHVKQASPAELARVDGIGPALAEKIHRALHAETVRPLPSAPQKAE